MERWHRWLRRLLHPPGRVLALLALLCAAALWAGPARRGLPGTLAAAVYTVSAYTLAALTVGAVELAAHLWAVLQQNRLLHRWRNDLRFKGRLTLYGSLAVNLLYALYKAAAALYYRSVWFGTMAAYYILLSTVRLALVRQLHTRQIDLRQEYRSCRFCGWLLLALTPVVIGIGVFLLHDGRAAVYTGRALLLAAAYTFYCVFQAAANLRRYRRLQSPVYSASRAIALATALVSLFSLTAAVLAALGGATTPLRRLLGEGTGLVVLLAIAAMAVLMLRRSGRALRQP